MFLIGGLLYSSLSKVCLFAGIVPIFSAYSLVSVHLENRKHAIFTYPRRVKMCHQVVTTSCFKSIINCERERSDSEESWKNLMNHENKLQTSGTVFRIVYSILLQSSLECVRVYMIVSAVSDSSHTNFRHKHS